MPVEDVFLLQVEVLLQRVESKLVLSILVMQLISLVCGAEKLHQQLLELKCLERFLIEERLVIT